ncbi:MAG TPA: tetratricopeptide repeat protein [Steroidobacteraceae bacterium]|nr:tetratricopeptide repeat protein [Steroidobacteraceae bacterium]
MQAASPAPSIDVDDLTVLMNRGQYAQVEMKTRPLLDLHPNSGPLWKLHAGALMLGGKDSLHAMQRASELLPTDAEIHFYLGNSRHDHGDLAGAAASQRRALALEADFVEAHDSLGTALQDAGQSADAAASFRRALELRPDFAEAHGNLGNALVDLGQFEDAVHHYRRMLELRPDLAEAHNNLGNALLSLRRFEEAATSYRRALALRPNAPGAHANLGNALHALGRPQEALTHCRRALELEPDSAEAELLKGNALFDLGLLDEAAASYARALDLKPNYTDAHIAAGKVLRQIGRITEAEESCRRALELAADSSEALALLGEIQADRGRFDDAEQLFRQAIAITPDQPEAWAGLARYRKMQPDAAWLAGAQRLLGKSLGVGQEINLRHALGKYFDDVRDFDNAFSSYRLANELKKRSALKYDGARLARRVDRIIAQYDTDWQRIVRAQGNESRRPVFIVGMPRSGTTLAEQILASHPHAFGCGELRFWHSASVDYETAALRGTEGREAIPAAAEKYLSLLAGFSGDASRVIDKMPANFMNLGLIHAAFPHARILHMQRNPLDTGLSIYFQVLSNTHTYANDLEDIAHYFTQYSRLMAHWRSTLADGTILEVPYEQLVADPEPWIRQIVQFVGLPWDPRCLRPHETERTVITASNWQVRQRINTSAAGRWRNYERHLGPLQCLTELES